MRSFFFSFFLILFCSTATCQGLQPEKPKIVDLIDLWKTVQNGEDLDILKELYAPRVNFYGEYKTPEGCVENVSRRHGNQNALLLTLKSDIHYTTFKGGVVKCSFIKGVYYGQVLKEYPAYLVLKKEKGNYKIIEEGDKISDQKPGIKSDWGPKVPLHLFLEDLKQPEKPKQVASAVWTWGIIGLGVFIVVVVLALYRRAAKRKAIQERPAESQGDGQVG